MSTIHPIAFDSPTILKVQHFENKLSPLSVPDVPNYWPQMSWAPQLGTAYTAVLYPMPAVYCVSAAGSPQSLMQKCKVDCFGIRSYRELYAAGHWHRKRDWSHTSQHRSWILEVNDSPEVSSGAYLKDRKGYLALNCSETVEPLPCRQFKWQWWLRGWYHT